MPALAHYRNLHLQALHMPRSRRLTTARTSAWPASITRVTHTTTGRRPQGLSIRIGNWALLAYRIPQNPPRWTDQPGWGPYRAWLDQQPWWRRLQHWAGWA